MSQNIFDKPVFTAVIANRSRRESIVFALVFSAEAAVCAILLWIGYSLASAPDLVWAIVSAFLVLQPEFSQSITIALTRVAANLIGAAVGLVVGATLGVGLGALIVAILIASLACGFFKLDVALRTACVAIVIVMNAGHEHIVASGTQRFLSVTIGCMSAILLQLATRPLTNRFRQDPPTERKDGE
jgi:uncharacterized membrane protein YgaE (UPF0421/DUF939 family)